MEINTAGGNRRGGGGRVGEMLVSGFFYFFHIISRRLGIDVHLRLSFSGLQHSVVTGFTSMIFLQYL